MEAGMQDYGAREQDYGVREQDYGVREKVRFDSGGTEGAHEQAVAAELAFLRRRVLAASSVPAVADPAVSAS